jgi:hypothetical protein
MLWIRRAMTMPTDIVPSMPSTMSRATLSLSTPPHRPHRPLRVHKMAYVRKALQNIASGNKPRKLRPPNTSPDDSATDLDLVSLPNAIPRQYPPLILIHVILLSAALVLLPQTPIPNLPLPPPTRGLDKPQPPFLTPFTARPVLTLAWACLGVALLVPWWAGSLRRWAHDGTLGPRSMQQRLAGDPHIRRVRALLVAFLPSVFLPLLQDIWNACILTAYATLALHVVVILFGAPFIECVSVYTPVVTSPARLPVHSLTRACLLGTCHTPHC